MAKKIITLSLLLALVATFAIAQTAPAAAPAAGPAKPVVGVDFSQRFDAGSAAGGVSATALQYPADTALSPLYGRTEVNANVAFDLGSGIKIAPWFRDRFETRLSSAAGVSLLSAFNFRNRAYVGLNTTAALDKAFNIGLNLEYRIESVLRTDKAQNATVAPPKTDYYGDAYGAVATRFAPILNINGKIDALAYNLSGQVDFYFDPSGFNSRDNAYTEIESTGNVSYTVKLDDLSSIAFSLNDYLDVTNPTNDGAGFTKAILPKLFNGFTPRITLAIGDFSPYAGFLWYVIQNDSTSITSDTNTDNVVGFSAGADLKVGQATFTFGYDFGVNQTAGAKNGQVESHTTAAVKIKA